MKKLAGIASLALASSLLAALAQDASTTVAGTAK